MRGPDALEERSMKLLPIVLAAATLGAAAGTAKPPAAEGRTSEQAKASFIKKCFRDRTKQACTAPPAARVQK
jgi:hypothetical protein